MTRYGALAGALLTASLVAVSYLGWNLAGLPFAPFDLFDWAARALPGSTVTLAIDTTVGIGRALHLASIGTAAKMAEQTAAVAAFLAGGVAVATLFFAVLRRSDEPAVTVGATLGLLLGASVLLVERRLDRMTSEDIGGAFWVFASLAAWGWSLGWTFDWLRANGVRAAGASAPDNSERRRWLIRFGAATIGTTAVAAVIGALAGRRRDGVVGQRWSDGHPLPNAASPVQPVRGTRPELTALENHYRIDTDTRVPRIDGARWRLRVGGLVDRPLALTLDELRGFDPLHQFVTLSCISNPVGGDLIGTTRWTGVSLQRLLPRFAPKPTATHLKLTSADGFFEVVALDTIRSDARVMLAYAWDGVPLLAEHGFPLRIYVPDVYGMKQPKWIEAIEAVDRWEPGYWVARGWDREGRVLTTSVVDATAGGSVGGIAYAGARGVSRVDVRVDDRAWQEARLREPLSETAWVVWRADLQAEAGSHTFTVRAVDGRGQTQAAGFHTTRART